MDRPRLIRGLRIAWSVWWGIVFVVLVMFWVRSYWWGNIVQTPHVVVFSVEARLRSIASHDRISRWGLTSRSIDNWHARIEQWGADKQTIGKVRWRFSHSPKMTDVLVPYWLPAVISGTLAAAPWVRLSNHF